MSFFDSNCTVGLHVKQYIFLKMSFQRAGKTLFLSHLAFQPNLKVVMSAKVCIISSRGDIYRPNLQVQNKHILGEIRSNINIFS